MQQQQQPQQRRGQRRVLEFKVNLRHQQQGVS